MTVRMKHILVFFLAVTVLAALIPPKIAAKDVNALEEFLLESRQQSNETFIWWIPEELWRLFQEQDLNFSEDQAEFIINSLDPYIVFLVAHGNFTSSGRFKYWSEAEILSDIRLIDSKYISHYPLAKNQLGPSVKKFLNELKPDFTEEFAKMGKKMYFILFASQNKNGEKIIDTSVESAFRIKIGKEEFTWQVPFESLIPPIKCPTCHRLLEGRYRFCPWDGTPLR